MSKKSTRGSKRKLRELSFLSDINILMSDKVAPKVVREPPKKYPVTQN